MTDETKNNAASDNVVDKLVERACSLWRSVSPVCTVTSYDKWNMMLKWRGVDLALLTKGSETVMVSVRRAIDGPMQSHGIIIIKDDETSEGKNRFARFVNEVTYLETVMRMWPDMSTDSAGNFLLKVGNGEYGKVEVTVSDLRYAIITSYDDRRKTGKWGYVDLKKLMAYTMSITQQIDKKVEKDTREDLDSLLEL